MSITEFRQAQRDDKRLEAELARDAKAQQLAAAQEAERLRLEAEERRREQDRKDKAQEAADRREREEAAARRKAEREEAEAKRRAAAEKEARRESEKAKAARKAARAAAVRAVPGWVSEHLDLAAAVAVMACSIVPALISQGSSLASAGLGKHGWWGVLLVALLPVMLECSAWASVAGEAKAMRDGRNPWPYRIAIYAFAALAAWVNWMHGHSIGGMRLGPVLAASSIVPVVVWQLVQLGHHREARAALKAKAKAKADAELDREQRKARYKDVYETALDLRAIAGHNALSEDDAWQAAYALYEGAGEEGMNPEIARLLGPDMLSLRIDAETRLAAVLEQLKDARTRRLEASAAMAPKTSTETPESVQDASAKSSTAGGIKPPTHPAHGSLHRAAQRVRKNASSQAAPSVPLSAPARETEPVRTRRPRPEPPKRTLSKGARNAARDTAKRSATVDAGAEKTALTEWALDVLKTAGDVSWKDIQAEAHRRRLASDKKAIEPSRSWAYAVRTAALDAAKRHGLHLVPSGEKSA